MTQVQAEAPARVRQVDAFAALMRFSTLAALIALVIFNMLFTPHFLTMQTLDVNLTQVAAIVIVGVGMTLVIATGGIDLSVGSLMAISGAIAPLIFLDRMIVLGNFHVAVGIFMIGGIAVAGVFAWLVALLVARLRIHPLIAALISLAAVLSAVAPIPFWNRVFVIGEVHVAVAVAMIIAILLGGAFGWFNGWLITRFRIQPIIGTLVLFIAGRGIAQVMTNGSLQPFKLDAFQWVGLGRLFPIQDVYRGVPIQVVIMLVMVAAAAWMLKRTLFGRQILAIGGNERAARLAGVPVAPVKRWVYCISGLCAGLAGLVTIAINSSSDANQVGLGMELDAIAAVAVGGTLLSGGRATVAGTLIGALIIQLVRYTMLANGVPDDVAKLAKAALIIAAVWLQSQGRA